MVNKSKKMENKLRLLEMIKEVWDFSKYTDDELLETVEKFSDLDVYCWIPPVSKLERIKTIEKYNEKIKTLKSLIEMEKEALIKEASLKLEKAYYVYEQLNEEKPLF